MPIDFHDDALSGIRRMIELFGPSAQIEQARVVAVPPQGNIAMIRRGGSSTLEVADLSDKTVEAGDMVLIARPSPSRRWVVWDTFTNERAGNKPSAPIFTNALASPDNFTVQSGRGFISLKWSTPPGYNLIYEIEIANDPGTYQDTSTVYVVGGSYVDVLEPGAQRAYRIRSVNAKFSKSGWTAWVTATAGGLRTGPASELPTIPYGEYWATDENALYVGDEVEWHVVSGSSSAGSAVWDVDAPPEIPHAMDDEFEDALVDVAWQPVIGLSSFQWNENDDRIRLSVDGSDTGVSLAYLNGLFKEVPDGDEYGALTIVAKVTLLDPLLMTDPSLHNSDSSLVWFGLALSEQPSLDGKFLTLGVNIENSSSGIYNDVHYWIWQPDSGSIIPIFGQQVPFVDVYLDTSIDTWYFRIRRDLSGSDWLLDWSYDGLNWQYGYSKSGTASNQIEKAEMAGIFLAARDINLDSIDVEFEFFRYRENYDALDDPVYGNYVGGSGGDMVRAVYDTDNDGIVDDSDKLDGKHASEFALSDHSHAIDDLSDVDTSTIPPSSGQALIWDNIEQLWKPGNVATGSSVSTSYLDDLSDVDTSTNPPVDGQVLIWDDINQLWIPGNIATGAGAPLSTTKTKIQTRTVLWEKVLASDGLLDTNDVDDNGNSGIPAGYDYLVLEGMLRSDRNNTGDTILIALNNDFIETNYQNAIRYSGSTDTNQHNDNRRVANMSANAAPSGMFGSIRAVVHHHEDTTKYTMVTAWATRPGGLDDVADTRASVLWANKDAVTRIELDPWNGTNFKAGSWLRVIGVKEQEVVTDVSGVANISTAGPDGNEPSASDGDLYLTTNSIYAKRYDGSKWQLWGPIYPLVPPNLDDFVWVNQGDAYVDTIYGGIHITAPPDTVNHWRLLTQSAPTPPYKVTAALMLDNPFYIHERLGVGWRDSLTNRLDMLSIDLEPTVTERWTVKRQIDPEIYDHNAVVEELVIGRPNELIWMRIEDDGTNRTYYVSSNGVYWHPIHSVSRTDWVSNPDQIFFGVEAVRTSKGNGHIWLVSWDVNYN